MQTTPFQRISNTHLIAVTSAASAGVQLSDGILVNNTVVTAHLYNDGTADVAVAFGATAALAVAAAVFPTAGNPQNVIIIRADSTEKVSIPPDSFISTIASGIGTATLYACVGFGI